MYAFVLTNSSVWTIKWCTETDRVLQYLIDHCDKKCSVSWAQFNILYAHVSCHCILSLSALSVRNIHFIDHVPYYYKKEKKMSKDIITIYYITIISNWIIIIYHSIDYDLEIKIGIRP